MSDRVVDPRFQQRMQELLERTGISYRALAARTFYARSYLHSLATGRKNPTIDAAKRIDEALNAGGELVGYVHSLSADDIHAAELAARVAASDLSTQTLQALGVAVDELAMAYATTPPEQLLPRVRQHIDYVMRLLAGRTTLAQHRELLVHGGWLTLLGATVHIDLRHHDAAAGYLTAADSMAEQAAHAEIRAWCLETRAWDHITAGQYAAGAELSRQAQTVAPRGSSAFIQATAQEGRAWARLGATTETLDVLARMEHLVANLAQPEHPEHHYRYDPAKAHAYTATTLAWLGDPSAERYARQILAELETGDGIARPRRAASARLDLALALLGAGKPDEAGHEVLTAVNSRRVVASNWWRVDEILDGIRDAGAPRAGELREASHALRPTQARS
jgi:transcriptional regulator with XRE-family HTH domain